jgi:glutathione S-transferase
MGRPIVYGPAGSTYVWSARLALAEKGVAHELVEVGFGQHREEPHLSRHPFAKVPAFEHDGFALYETQAILRYVDDAFPGRSLQPVEPRSRARMNLVIGIVDAYLFPFATAAIGFQRLIAPRLRIPVDEAKITAAVPKARTCLIELDRLVGDSAYMAGDALSLADLMLAPHIDGIRQTPEGAEILRVLPALTRWWARIDQRSSIARTRPRYVR